MDKKILIFGSKGLVGSSVNRIFSNDNYEIFSSSREDTNLFNLQEVQSLIESFKPNIIVNAAAKVGGILANNTHRSEFLIQNLKININILESIIPFPNTKIINLGSSCIYPLDAPNPIKESSFMDGKLEPTNSPYAMAKLTAIELGRSLNLQFGHKVINLMPTNLYGPNDNFDGEASHVIPGLINKMYHAKLNKDDKFLIWGTGSPLREFLYVDDLARGIKFIIEENIEDDLINIGSGSEISIKDLGRTIKEVVGYKGSLDFDKTKPDGNPRKLLDSSIINNYGWEPKVELTEGLNLAFNWFKENITN
ncbi:GDP-L-fucose synthase [Acidimicrobiia bacterium]|jgi:GDP-L-fucose synthase|nr:GDP-L-fucose synthase [Acidimicrobiia bacterium]MDB4834163.1 GDP-L-fucose synthase [Acidimicrobiia bacterium]